MLPVITPEEANRMDHLAAEPVETLMERAGYGISIAAGRMGAGYGWRVAVLVGPGNNGGDGYVAGRFLADRGAEVTIHQLAPPKTPAAKQACQRAFEHGIVIRPIGFPKTEDLVIDAVFGGGFRGELPSPITAWIEAQIPVLAVDVPTGLDPLTGEIPSTCFRAQHTVTFGALRTGHLLGQGPDYCGETTVVAIGWGDSHPTLRLTEAEDAPRPARHRRSHKWSVGSVLVVGGTSGMTGAAVLAGKAALRFGAGSVGVATPNQALIAGTAPELLTYPIDQAINISDRFDTVVIGPGLGGHHQATVIHLLAERDKPMVIDADGLNGISADQLSQARGPTIITPHAGEFSRITQKPSVWEHAVQLAAESNTIVLMKGNPTFVCSPDREVWVVNSGGPELATIGTGDVLAGMVGALVATGLSPQVAARSAAYWHGRAGAELVRHRTVTADQLAIEVGRWSGARKGEDR